MHPEWPRPPTENAVDFYLDDPCPSAVACYSHLKSWDLAYDCLNTLWLNSAHKGEHKEFLFLVQLLHAEDKTISELREIVS